MKYILKYMTLLFLGGFLYCLIEILARGHTHWSMFFVGGVCFLVCGGLNELYSWDMPLPKQMLICSMAITIVEFIGGVVLNVILDLGVWDYSKVPFNVMGQICLPFTIIWFFLSLAAIVVDDYLRFWLFGEEKPRYKWRRQHE